MIIFLKISSWFSGFFRRRRLAIFDTRDNREGWYTHISIFGILMVFISSLIIVFALTLSLVRYSNILDPRPKYRIEELEQRAIIIDNIIRIDSMERVINDMMLYSDNVALIMNGKTPRIYQNLTSNSATLSKTTLQPTLADSILRSQMEGEGRYNLQLASFGGEEYMRAPADGVITRQFNIAEGSYGVDIAATAGRVMAIQRGVVSLAQWSLDNQYTIQIIHPDNSVSIYHNIRNAVVKRGDSVKAGEIIGDNNETSDTQMDSRQISFEIWSDGKPIDPEKYISF